MNEFFSVLKTVFGDILPATRPQSLNLPQTAPPAGKQVFKTMSLWGRFSFHPSRREKMEKGWRMEVGQLERDRGTVV